MQSSTQASDILTMGDLRRETGEPEHRLKYALQTHNISPVARAGIVRLWARHQLPEIKSALTRTAERRTEARANA
jgi:hypothetical protein